MKKNVFRLKVGLPLVLALMAGQLQANVTITEVMQSNFGGVIDYYNEFPDSWVEVHNSGDKEIDLKGYAISEVNNIDSAFVLPNSLKIPANGYALIYCDKEDREKEAHTDFRLNSDKPGAIYLWDDKGAFLDSLHYPEMISPEVSWGRLPDNPDSLSHFRIPTPGNANNDTYTERVMKKVDFSVDGGAKKEPFYLKLSMKGDLPKDAVIRYTTNGSEPTEKSYLYTDSILISKNTVVRAKAFSDSAISKISKTNTYIFDRGNKMPILSIVTDDDYLYDAYEGILSWTSIYAETHPDVYFSKQWLGDENFYYNWRRPINIEYYPSDSTAKVTNQLAETRVCGNISRQEAKVKSMVFYANKRFGDKHFKNTFWGHLRPNANKQKSMSIRSIQSHSYYNLTDLVCQVAIGRFAKYYDVDFQAHRNVQFFINGEFQTFMNLTERDGEDFVWANHNVSDIEILETSTGLYEGFIDDEVYPNYFEFRDIFETKKSTYQQMEEKLDINAFMNHVSTQAYFANVDYPYNNSAVWYDKQGTKKWRYILKDMDATFHDPEYAYYNFLLRVEPFEGDPWSNSPLACEVYIKMFSFAKFKQQYIDRTCAIAGTAFSKNTIDYMLDSLANEMSLSMTADEMDDYLSALNDMYEWNESRSKFYYNDLSYFFRLGDTTQLTINGLHKDSIIYINNNPLMENKYEGYFFENRNLYLTHSDTLDIYGLKIPDTNSVLYLNLEPAQTTTDSSKTRWTISYLNEGDRIYEHYTNENLFYRIPRGAKDVKITDGFEGEKENTSAPVIVNHAPRSLSYMVYTIGGAFVGKFNYDEIREFKQSDEINIVVAVDSNNKKVHSFKLIKE